MKHMRGLAFAVLVAAASVVPLGPAKAGNLELMPSGNWAQKVPDIELEHMRGALGITFDISIIGSIANLGDLEGATPVPPPGFGFNVSNGQASITTHLGGVSGNGIFVFNQLTNAHMNVVNTTVVVNVTVNGLN